jgi:hypothetical protein
LDKEVIVLLILLASLAEFTRLKDKEQRIKRHDHATPCNDNGHRSGFHVHPIRESLSAFSEPWGTEV